MEVIRRNQTSKVFLFQEFVIKKKKKMFLFNDLQFFTVFKGCETRGPIVKGRPLNAPLTSQNFIFKYKEKEVGLLTMAAFTAVQCMYLGF